jgi:hypothetical protein
MPADQEGAAQGGDPGVCREALITPTLFSQPPLARREKRENGKTPQGGTPSPGEGGWAGAGEGQG